MFSFIHYISARQRLTEVEKTVKMLGENEVPYQILAQRDFIKLEMEYYRDVSITFFKFFCLFSMFFLLCVVSFFVIKG